MRILIEGGSIFGRPSSVGQYTKRLLKAMAALNRQNQYVVFKFNFWLRPLPKLGMVHDESIHWRFIRAIPGRAYTLLFKLGWQIPINWLLRTKADVIWFPNFV